MDADNGVENRRVHSGFVKSADGTAGRRISEVARIQGVPPMLGLTAEYPSVANLNVTNSSRVHIGPKFVSVTQDVSNREVEGRILGRGVKSSPAAHSRCRAWLLVFVCSVSFLACVVCGLVMYLAASRSKRLDLEVTCGLYVINLVKDSSKTERGACALAMIALLICFLVIIYFFVLAANESDEIVDEAPHEWNITRDMWLAQPYNQSLSAKEFEPLRLVIINHSVSTECDRFLTCAAQMRHLQLYFLDNFYYDIPYNFVIGNDGRVYEGRGWSVVGAHSKSYNNCSLGIGFIGDYRENPWNTRVTEKQIEHMVALLSAGERLGHLTPDYALVGAKDLALTESPGENLYNVIRTFHHYDNQRYRGMTCNQIMGVL